MTHIFKTGAIALVEAGCWANTKVALRLDEGWSHVNGVSLDDDGIVTPIRPLAVIDPEDRQAVERLILAIPANRDWYFVHTGVDGNPVVDEDVADNVQAALREFAAPTPPRPNEPTGRFAEVENAEGMTYYRSPCGSWRRASDDLIRDWQAIDVRRVLSEGIEQP